MNDKASCGDRDDAPSSFLGVAGERAHFQEGLQNCSDDERRDCPCSDAQERTFVENKRSLLEDPLQIQWGTGSLLASRGIPEEQVRYLRAAVIAYDMDIRFERALDLYARAETYVPPIHKAFQEMYFEGKDHIEETVSRMHPTSEPSSGEVFADAALMRARNSYYVAALLYREGHMIEAHALSRLMLEQIAWAFAVCRMKSFDEAKKVSPTRAIGRLKEVIPSVGKLYGVLSQYVHLPLDGHCEFITLKHGQSEASLQFDAHSYAYGVVISRLADYWSIVYEYAEAVHFDELENWAQSSSGMVLDEQRPFLSRIMPLREALMEIYERENVSYDEYLKSNWTIDAVRSNEDEPHGCDFDSSDELSEEGHC